jgi:uncharacterized protein YegP (UPF0339 family)
MYKFEVFRDSNSLYRWRVTTSNGYVVAIGDPRYPSAELARQAVLTVREKLSKAEVPETREVARAA